MGITHAIETYRSLHNSRLRDVEELKRSFSEYDSKSAGTLNYE